MGPVCTNYEIWLTTDHTHTTLIPCYSTSILASSTSCVEMINNEHCHTCFHCSSTCVITVRILLKYFLQKSKICRDGGWSYIYRLTKFTYKEWKFMYYWLTKCINKNHNVWLYMFHTCNHAFLHSSSKIMRHLPCHCYLCRDGCMLYETYSHTLWFFFMHFVSQ